MTRHPIRWSRLIFGLLFLAGVGEWAVSKQHWMTQQELSLTASAVVIGLGLLGVVATFWKPSQLTTTPDLEDHTSRESSEHEEIDPQS